MPKTPPGPLLPRVGGGGASESATPGKRRPKPLPGSLSPAAEGPPVADRHSAASALRLTKNLHPKPHKAKPHKTWRAEPISCIVPTSQFSGSADSGPGSLPSATAPLQPSGSRNLNPRPHETKPPKTWRGPVFRVGGRQLGGRRAGRVRLLFAGRVCGPPPRRSWPLRAPARPGAPFAARGRPGGFFFSFLLAARVQPPR